MKLGLTEYVDCAHFLEGHPRCGRLHGHTYRIDVTIAGETKDGMVLDFAVFREKVRSVLEPYDHILWNDVLEYPSVENICALLARRLGEALPYQVSIRVFEGRGKWAEL